MINTTSGKIKTNLRDVTNLGNGFFLFRFLWVNLWPKKIRYRQWLTENVRGRITKIVTSQRTQGWACRPCGLFFYLFLSCLLVPPLSRKINKR